MESYSSKISNISFRDPGGRIVKWNNRIIRVVHEDASLGFKEFLSSALARQLIEAGTVPRSKILPLSIVEKLHKINEFQKIFEWSGKGGLAVEHERISFPSFPYEWSPRMLHAAAELTIDLSVCLLDVGLGIKDATPYNIFFRGPRPIHIDLLSFEKRDPRDPTWLAYAQFIRTFLLPLLVIRYFDLTLDQIMMVRRDGLEPKDVYRMCNPFRRLKSPFLAYVTVPVWLSRNRSSLISHDLYAPRKYKDPEMAHYVLLALFKRLSRILNENKPKDKKKSLWSMYMVSKTYLPEDFKIKEDVVTEILREHPPHHVLDIGCNTGHFSILAARCGIPVIAIDDDPVVIDQLWETATKERLDILPLVVNIARPTPAIGWRNQEYPSFLVRSHGFFDTVFMLAIIHHLLVAERIPLDEIIALAADLTTNILVIEYVPPDDQMFLVLTRGRQQLHVSFTQKSFEEACSTHFKILRVKNIGSSKRILYVLKKRKSLP